MALGGMGGVFASPPGATRGDAGRGEVSPAGRMLRQPLLGAGPRPPPSRRDVRDTRKVVDEVIPKQVPAADAPSFPRLEGRAAIRRRSAGRHAAARVPTTVPPTRLLPADHARDRRAHLPAEGRPVRAPDGRPPPQVEGAARRSCALPPQAARTPATTATPPVPPSPTCLPSSPPAALPSPSRQFPWLNSVDFHVSFDADPKGQLFVGGDGGQLRLVEGAELDVPLDLEGESARPPRLSFFSERRACHRSRPRPPRRGAEPTGGSPGPPRPRSGGQFHRGVHVPGAAAAVEAPARPQRQGAPAGALRARAAGGSVPRLLTESSSSDGTRAPLSALMSGTGDAQLLADVRERVQEHPGKHHEGDGVPGGGGRQEGGRVTVAAARGGGTLTTTCPARRS